MLKLTRLKATLVALAACCAGQAWAETMSYEFTGSIFNMNDIEDLNLGVVPELGSSFSGTITYDLDAIGTPYAWGATEEDVLGIHYLSPIPPAKMTLTIAGVTLSAAQGTDLSVLVGDDVPSNLFEPFVDSLIFASQISDPGNISFNLRLEDTTRSAFSDPELPEWIDLEAFDLRGIELYGPATRLNLIGTVRTLTPVAKNVSIDIRPGRFPNRVGPTAHEFVSVAVLNVAQTSGDPGFNPFRVNPATVHFGVAGTEATPVSRAFHDVDGDGDQDLIFFFRVQESEISCPSTTAKLTGRTFGGQPFVGIDSVRTIACDH
jgi:hypothetical protein